MSTEQTTPVKPPSLKSEKKLLIGLAILLILMFVMTTAIMIRLSSNIL